jgi:aspartyl aminopeptidase
MAATEDPVDELRDFIDRSATPWHAARNGADMLIAEGFDELPSSAEWSNPPARGVVVRGGSLIAWTGAPGADGTPMRLIGAHTDSPGLRLRPHPDLERAATRQLGVEVYGGPLLNSWLDRDLTVAGRVVVRDPDTPNGTGVRLFHHRDPLLRVAQLAIHLDRDVNEGLALDRQRHLHPIWGLTEGEPGEDESHHGFRGFLAELVGVDPDEVLSWDAQLADVEPPRRLGRHFDLLAAPRLDNLCSCFGALKAIAAHPESSPPAVVVLNDHEEVGSTSATGAVGAWLYQVLERIAEANGGSRSRLLESLAGSVLLSADMAHGTHPNYEERHEPSHHVFLGGGPVIKHNVSGRYATDATTSAAFRIACEGAAVPFQEYSHRGDLPCGSTIGPLTAAVLAVDTVDVGMAQLSMHSARELMACADVQMMCDAFTAWLAGGPGELDNC